MMRFVKLGFMIFCTYVLYASDNTHDNKDEVAWQCTNIILGNPDDNNALAVESSTQGVEVIERDNKKQAQHKHMLFPEQLLQAFKIVDPPKDIQRQEGRYRITQCYMSDDGLHCVVVCKRGNLLSKISCYEKKTLEQALQRLSLQ